MIAYGFDPGSNRGKRPEDDGLVGAAAEQAGAVGCEADGRDGRGVVVQRLDDVIVSAKRRRRLVKALHEAAFKKIVATNILWREVCGYVKVLQARTVLQAPTATGGDTYECTGKCAHDETADLCGGFCQAAEDCLEGFSSLQKSPLGKAEHYACCNQRLKVQHRETLAVGVSSALKWPRMQSDAHTIPEVGNDSSLQKSEQRVEGFRDT